MRYLISKVFFSILKSFDLNVLFIFECTFGIGNNWKWSKLTKTELWSKLAKTDKWITLSTIFYYFVYIKLSTYKRRFVSVWTILQEIVNIFIFIKTVIFFNTILGYPNIFNSADFNCIANIIKYKWVCVCVCNVYKDLAGLMTQNSTENKIDCT